MGSGVSHSKVSLTVSSHQKNINKNNLWRERRSEAESNCSPAKHILTARPKRFDRGCLFWSLQPVYSHQPLVDSTSMQVWKPPIDREFPKNFFKKCLFFFFFFVHINQSLLEVNLYWIVFAQKAKSIYWLIWEEQKYEMYIFACFRQNRLRRNRLSLKKKGKKMDRPFKEGTERQQETYLFII